MVWGKLSGRQFGGNECGGHTGAAPGREGKREGLKVGTILSKIVPEVARGSAYPVACLSARDLFQPFEKIVPDFLARASSAFLQTMRPYPSRQQPCRGLRIYIRKIVRTDRRGSTGIPGTRPPYQISRRGGGARLGAGASDPLARQTQAARWRAAGTASPPASGSPGD